MPPATARGRATAPIGLLVVVGYLAVAFATDTWAPVRLRPLFDGFASHPGAYLWVTPPEEFAEGNRPPEQAQARISFGAGGSSAVLAETLDGQAMASVPAGAVAPRASDGAATLDLRPLDATTLGPLPPGLRPEGNAYRVTITYVPSDAPVLTLSTPGVVGVTSREASDTLLFSADGRSWRAVDGKPVAGGRGFTGALTEVGYFLAAGRGEPRPLVTGGGGFPLALLVLGAAVPLILGYLFLSQRRQAQRAAASKAKPGSGARPGSKAKAASGSRPAPKPKKRR